MLKFIFFYLSLFLCLNLSQAQTGSTASVPPTVPIPSSNSTPPIVITPTNSSAITTPPTSTITPGPATSATGETLGSIKAAPGKYEEYLSICRTNNFDNIFYLSDELKNKRIKLLQDKIASTKEANKIRLRLLKEYVDQHKLTEANDAYAEIKRQKLTTTEGLLADGYLNFLQKKLKISQANLEKVVAAEPKNIEAIKFLAEIYREEKNFFEAAQIYEDLNKEFSGGYNESLCEVLILDSHHADGEKACKKAIIEKPENPYPLIFLGISSREKENLTEAYDYFKDSLKVKETEMGLTCLAEIYFIQNKFDSAIDNFNKSANHTPKSTRALVGLAWAQLKNKNIDDALQNFAKICKMDRALVPELRKAYKFLLAQNSPGAKKFIDQIQLCNQ